MNWLICLVLMNDNIETYAFVLDGKPDVIILWFSCSSAPCKLLHFFARRVSRWCCQRPWKYITGLLSVPFDSPLMVTFFPPVAEILPLIMQHVLMLTCCIYSLSSLFIYSPDLGHAIETLGALKESCFSSDAYADVPLGTCKWDNSANRCLLNVTA